DTPVSATGLLAAASFRSRRSLTSASGWPMDANRARSIGASSLATWAVLAVVLSACSGAHPPADGADRLDASDTLDAGTIETTDSGEIDAPDSDDAATPHAGDADAPDAGSVDVDAGPPDSDGDSVADDRD